MRPTDLVPVIRLIDDEYFRRHALGFKLQTGPRVNSRIEEIISGVKADYWQSLLKKIRAYSLCMDIMNGRK